MRTFSGGHCGSRDGQTGINDNAVQTIVLYLSVSVTVVLARLELCEKHIFQHIPSRHARPRKTADDEVDNFPINHRVSAAAVCLLLDFFNFFLYRPEPLCIILRWSIKTCVL